MQKSKNAVRRSKDDKLLYSISNDIDASNIVDEELAIAMQGMADLKNIMRKEW